MFCCSIREEKSRQRFGRRQRFERRQRFGFVFLFRAKEEWFVSEESLASLKKRTAQEEELLVSRTAQRKEDQVLFQEKEETPN